MKEQSRKYSVHSLTGRTGAASVFRHFCRGGYAVFASLHREVRIGVLTVGMLASVNIPKVQALQVSAVPDAEEDGDETELAEVSVSGTMAPLTALQSARIVSVITAQQIESSAAQSVNDLLKNAVGVDVRQRGGFGIQTDISINGGTFDQITILLNGVNITSPHTGHLAADFPVSLADIERIEILEGAASRVYGASAFGGAINIVTKRGPTPDPSREGGEASGEKAKRISFEAGVQGGSYATFGGDARLSFSKNSAPTFSLSSTIQRSDGATVNSDFQRGSLYLHGIHQLPSHGERVGASLLHLQAGYSQKTYGANTFYSAAYPNQHEANNRLIISLGATHQFLSSTGERVGAKLHPEIYWQRLLDHFELIRGTHTDENFHRTDVHGARVSADVSWVAGRTAVGAEVRNEEIYSTTLGKPITEPHTQKVPGQDLYYDHHDRRTNISFNAEHNILLPRFTASIGVLCNYNTRFDDRLRLYPGIDLAYTPAPRWRLFASYNKGFRLPTFTDLYYKSPTHEGNQDMKAEESHSFQLGATCRIAMATATLKGFYHRGTDMIDWVMYAPGDVFHSANFNLDNWGFQASTHFQFPMLNVQLSYAYINQHRRDQQPIYKSNYTMEYLRHKVVVTLDHRIAGRLSASWSLRWQDRMGSYILYENAQSTGQLVPYRPYATLDLKLRWKAPCCELWFEGTNLTNRTYYDLGNVPQPGLLLLAGLRINLPA